jgi:hypothetical protein
MHGTIFQCQDVQYTIRVYIKSYCILTKHFLPPAFLVLALSKHHCGPVFNAVDYSLAEGQSKPFCTF